MLHANRICFLGNGTKTDFFRKVANQLNSETTRVSWIVVNASQRDTLTAEFGEDDVLYLSLGTPERRAPFDIKINDLVYADRRLRDIKANGLAYLRAIQGHIFDFLESGVPTLVVGELTYGHEVLTFRMTEQVLSNCHWVSPFLTRIPQGKFAFFSDEAFSREAVSSVGAPVVQQTTKDIVGYKEMNSRHIDRQNSRDLVIGKVRSFVARSQYDPDEPSWNGNNRAERLKRNAVHAANRLSYRRVPKVGIEAIDACRGRSVIFPLHMQPELNIDTCGRYWENQTETILTIWRQLGPEDALFIKEHPVAIGNRGAGWYRRLLAHPNLHLLHHSAPVDEILRKVDYVFTISGTMGLEAALLGRKVFCLAPTTYDRLRTVVSPEISDFRRAVNIDDLYERLAAEKSHGWEIEDYLRHLEEHAFPGDAEGDAVANPQAWGEANLKQVALAFEWALASLGSRGEGERAREDLARC